MAESTATEFNTDCRQQGKDMKFGQGFAVQEH